MKTEMCKGCIKFKCCIDIRKYIIKEEKAKVIKILNEMEELYGVSQYAKPIKEWFKEAIDLIKKEI